MIPPRLAAHEADDNASEVKQQLRTFLFQVDSQQKNLNIFLHIHSMQNAFQGQHIEAR